MKIKTGFAIFMMFSMMIASMSIGYATPTVSIKTEKEIYSYGDFLSFTIQVSEITGESAILNIIDESGKKSSAIPIPITELKTEVPSPFPFESNIYPLGMYTLEIQYSGSSSMTEFELIDSGNSIEYNKVLISSGYSSLLNTIIRNSRNSFTKSFPWLLSVKSKSLTMWSIKFL